MEFIISTVGSILLVFNDSSVDFCYSTDDEFICQKYYLICASLLSNICWSVLVSVRLKLPVMLVTGWAHWLGIYLQRASIN